MDQFSGGGPRYDIGDVEPDELRQYVWRSDKSKIVTIPVYQVDNLLKLIAAVGGATDPTAAPAQ